MTELDARIRKIFDSPDPVSVEEILDWRGRRSTLPRRPGRGHLRRAVAVGVGVALIAGLGIYATTRRPGTAVTVAGSTPAPPAEPIAFALSASRTINLPSSPLARRSSTAVAWTGEEMLIWGGGGEGGTPLGDGASYTPSTGKWQLLPKSPPRGRHDPLSVWTGQEWIVWGGTIDVGQRAVTAIDGAAYEPATGRWMMLPAAPSSLDGGQTEVWTGAEMIIVSDDGNVVAAYTPGSNSWHRIATPPAAPTNAAPNSQEAVWTGRQAVFLMQNDDNFRNGQFLASYNPARDTWSKTASGHITDGTVPILVWDGRDIVLLGLRSWNPTTGAWAKLPNAPTDVTNLYSGQTVVWTGTLILLWGPTRHHTRTRTTQPPANGPPSTAAPAPTETSRPSPGPATP